jgi:uncharacterized membrane protein
MSPDAYSFLASLATGVLCCVALVVHGVSRPRRHRHRVGSLSVIYGVVGTLAFVAGLAVAVKWDPLA